MKTKIGALMIAAVILCFISSFAMIAMADTSDVTTRWIVPADTTIAISFPNGESLVEFNAAGKNFTDLGASSQVVGSSALRVTNNGNTAVKLEFNWTTEWPTGVEFVNISIADWSDNTTYGDDYVSFGDSNETIKQEVEDSLADGGTQDFWFWSTGHDVDETAGVDRSLRITSTNV